MEIADKLTSEASECCRLITAESVSNLEAVSILAAVSMTAVHNYDLYDLTWSHSTKL